MSLPRLFAFSCAIAVASCSAFDTTNYEMTPLEGTGPKPNVRNRFPEERGGFQHSRADKMEEDMTMYERIVGQY